MWKIAIGFIIFAAIAMYVVIKGGDSLSLGGEQHGPTESHAPAAAPAASAPAVAASAPASAASN